MLISKELPLTMKALDDYILDVPSIEKDNVEKIKRLTEQASESEVQALKLYPELFSAIKEWYQQLVFTDVNVKKSIKLIQQTNTLLNALATDCKSLSWALSLLVPSSLYNEIEQLLEIGQTKERALEKYQLNVEPPVDLEKSPEQKLKELLNSATLILVKKVSAIAEKKTDYFKLLKQLKQLNDCLSSQEPYALQKFWLHYSNKEAFMQLMDVLLLTQAEKSAWLHSFEYFRMNKPKETNVNNTINSLLSLSNYQLKGSSISKESLTKKMNQAIKFLYDQIIEDSMKKSNTSEWLDDIDASLKGSKINPLLHELMTLQTRLTQPLQQLEYPISNYAKILKTLSQQVSQVSQKNVKIVRSLRQDLKTLSHNYETLQLHFKEIYQQHNDIINQLNTLNALSGNDDFKMTEINSDELVELTSKVSQNLYHHFIKQLPNLISNISDNKLEKIFDEINNLLITQTKKTQTCLNDLNNDGDTEREKALQELKIFLTQQQGLWDRILRFFSYHYRCCMAEIDSVLRTKDSTLNKVSKVKNHLQNTQKKSSFFISQRVKFFAESNKEGMFLEEEESEVKGNSLLELSLTSD